MSEEIYHVPALFEEALSGLDIKPGGVYVDVTFGGGGHSRGILSRLGESGRLYGFDRDLDALANVPSDARFTFVHSNFRYISNFMRYHGEEHVDGILADLGVSFHHFDSAERGFSFRSDAPLDMRMNRRGGITAAEFLASASEESLLRVFRAYTDLKRPHALVKALLAQRDRQPVATTFQLAEAAAPALNPRQEKKELAQVFQALRIEVNGEMEALGRFLESSAELLRDGGRLAVITYHSIEDRMVKNFIKTGNIEGVEHKDFFGRLSTPWRPVNRSPVVPSQEEVERNPRSRSAKLRVAEKISDSPSLR